MEISKAEYMDPANGWHQYRTSTAKSVAQWMVERLPSVDDAEYAMVDRGRYWTIAVRYTGPNPDA